MFMKPFLFILCFLCGAVVEASSPLTRHFSPYLAMHADDPVSWRLWSDDVLQEARRENKLIFISSGYFACHWCHVMQRESFHNEAIATVLNRIAIPVKVDRELTPELDAALIDFVEQTRGAAGWPLNVFLTPQGYPLVGTVYLPPDDFLAFVERLEQRWIQEGELLAQLARRAAQQKFKRMPKGKGISVSQLRERLRERLSEAIQQQGDFLAGGLDDGAKFPNVPLLETLLFQVERDESLKAFTVLTLEQIAGQGLHDHIGGGFFRYTVDPNWQQPHFEKMLYDNALLARLYLHASKALKMPAWRALALQTIDFMLHEMWHREGAFIASLSAVDEAGVEGGYYLWTHNQLQAVLGEQRYRLVNVAWGFHGAVEWGEGLLPIPSLSEQEIAVLLGKPVIEIGKQLLDARQAMMRERQRRSIPRDEKRLAGWNGLALSALSEVLDAGTGYRQSGRAVRNYLHSLWDGEQLWRMRVQEEKNGIPGTLEDYVYVAQGLLDWTYASDDRQSRELAEKLVRSAWQRFHGERGWYRGEGEAIRVFSPESPMLSDGPLPSPSALWVRLNRKLGEQVPIRETLLADPETLLDKALHYPSYLVELELVAQ